MNHVNPTSDSNSGEEFLRRMTHAKEGDEQQKAELLNEFRQYLREVASQMIGGEMRAKLGSSDFVQETLISAQEAIANCRAKDEVEFKAWLRKILLNDILNTYRDLRRKKRDIRRELRVDSRVILQHDEDSPSKLVSRKEQSQRLAEIIAELPEETQAIFQYRHRDGLTFVEIANKLGRTPDSVRMNWNRALKKIASQLDD